MDDVVGGFISGVLVSAFMFCIWSKSPKDFKKEAIKKGFAEYSQTTGKWQWKELKEVLK